MLRFAGFAMGIAVMAMNASAQPACPEGSALKSQAVAADSQISMTSGSSPLSQRARALVYLTYASAADNNALDDLPIFLVPVLPCDETHCPEGISLTREEQSQMRALAMSDIKGHETGEQRKSWALVLGKIASPERIQWAENVLGCTFGGGGSIVADPTPAPAPQLQAPSQELVVDKYSGPAFGPSEPTQAPPPQPTQRTIKVYGDWAYGTGYYCRNNEFQTDAYAKANAKKACRDMGGDPSITVVGERGYDAYKANADQCYQARAYTDCIIYE